MTKRESEHAIDVFSRAFFDVLDLQRRLICPWCGLCGFLHVSVEISQQRIYCAAPMPRDEDGYNSCKFESIFYATTVSDLPTPQFVAVEPSSGRKRRRVPS